MSGNPIAELLADALALALARPEVIEAARAILAPSVAVEADPPGLVSKPRAAKAIGRSTATLDRLCAEGAPVHFVGSRRMFDLAEARAWLDARGRKPTVAKASDRVDVAEVCARAGLRAVGAGRVG